MKISDSISLLSKFVPYSDRNFKERCGIKLKIIKRPNPVNTLRPRDSFCFPLISFDRNFKKPIPAQNCNLKQQVPLSTSQNKAYNQLPVYSPLPSPRQSHSPNDPKTLPGPRPLLLAASTLAPAEISCSTTAAWPFEAVTRSAVAPQRRGCDADGGCGCQQETKRSHGMFLRVVGQIFLDGS